MYRPHKCKDDGGNDNKVEDRVEKDTDVDGDCSIFPRVVQRFVLGMSQLGFSASLQEEINVCKIDATEEPP